MGKKWLNFMTKKGTVLFIDEESGPRRLASRLGEVLRGHDGDDNTKIAFVSLEQLNLREEKEIEALKALVEKVGASFVVIDSLAGIIPGADENAVKDVQPIFMGVRRVAESTQAAILIIHHANKIGKYRGSSALKAAVDLLIKVESEPDSPEITFKTEKSRDTAPMKFAAEAHFAEPEFWLSPTEMPQQALPQKPSQDYVLGYLEMNGPSKLKDIVNNADICSGGTARNMVFHLQKEGLITRVDEGGQGKEATYDLTREVK